MRSEVNMQIKIDIPANGLKINAAKKDIAMGKTRLIIPIIIRSSLPEVMS